tara:strand:+ start:861 stop:2114 length:1254 start_codon:yes stop_codon:yes gene_type:complete
MISRFRFNISIYETLKYLFYIPIFSKKNLENDLKNKLSKYYEKSDFYFYDHGRTALYEILREIKKYTKRKKILINSLTLFEIVNVIIYAGFEPEFVDNKSCSFETQIDLNTNVNDIAAIVVTHLNGANQNIIELKEKIDLHNKKNDKIFLIEDCAVSLGSKINNKFVGSYSDYSFLSFNIMKNITSYTGGVLIDNKMNDIKISTSHFKKPLKINIIKKMLFVLMIQFLNTKIIFPFFFKFIKLSHKYSFNFFLKKYRTDFEVKIDHDFPNKFQNLMHNFQKFILLKQFDNLEEKQILRINKSKIYYEKLKKLNNLDFPQTDFNEKNIFLDFPIICKSKNIQNSLFKYLMDKQIDVKNYYYANCSEKGIYNSTHKISINSKAISENIIMLPVHEDIKKSYQIKISDEIINFFNLYEKN